MTHSPADNVRTESEWEYRANTLEQQLVRSQRLAALGELLGTTTHEFNNVLMTILNYARMAQRHKDEPTRDKAIEKILMATKRATKITSSILAVVGIIRSAMLIAR